MEQKPCINSLSPMKQKSVFIRIDKIGDLIATLPVDQADFLRDHEVHWVINSQVTSVMSLAKIKRLSWSIDLGNRWKSFWKLIAFLKKNSTQRVIIFYGPWWVSLATLFAKVPIRIGRRSQWHSYRFLNKSLRQSRSLSERHESSYNWKLLHFAFDQPVDLTSPAPLLTFKVAEDKALLKKFDLNSKAYVVVHPGMAGSSLNWPQNSYNSLIENLIQFTDVVITGTENDSEWLTKILPLWKDHKKVHVLVGLLTMEDLVFILKNASVVVAPSTGIIHLAAATEVPVVGLFSPLRSQHPRRWGPRGNNSRTLLPKVQCPAKSQCLRENCEYNFCMYKITPAEVLKEIQSFIRVP